MKQLITLNINNQNYDVVVTPMELLVDVIRKTVGLTGTKRVVVKETVALVQYL